MSEEQKEKLNLSPPTGGQGAWIEIIQNLQDKICSALEACDGKAKFIEDKWEREEGGGGKTRVIANGNVFEKGGVNTSVVHGKVTDAMRNQLKIDGDTWWAAGISIVIHPHNPFVPTIHCNYRMFELYDSSPEGGGREGAVIDRWYGGGTDLTPYYLIEEDAIHFHQTYKNVCDSFDESFYPEFKKTCDNYFVNWHRNNERRGIGGIFYDHKSAPPKSPGGGHTNSQPSRVENQKIILESSVREAGALVASPIGGSRKGAEAGAFWMDFGKACGEAFIDAYIPIVEKRKDTTFNEQHKYWQEIRRGRYVEFNLVHDRGTIFGLKTNGRIESILMSLPPTVRFEYNYQPPAGSEEDKLQQVCLHPREWV